MYETLKFNNGTTVTTGDDWCVTRLSGGEEIHACPNDDSLDMAMALGYGYDVARMTREHDAIHSALADWVGYGESRSLRSVAGLEPDGPVAWAEEGAVLAIQKLINEIRNERPANA